MTMRAVSEHFPEFSLRACVSRDPRIAFRHISNNSFPGKWIIYLFWPMDFTPICASEVADFAETVDEFEQRDAVLLGISVDSEFVHLAWCRTTDKRDELVPFPLLADLKRELVIALGIMDASKGVAQRATFIVDPGQTIRHASVNDFSVGRNPREMIRILDGLQTDALCPSSWRPGEPTIERETTFIEQMIVEDRRL